MIERGILFTDAVSEFEKRFIKRMLEKNEGNHSKAAVALGIHRNTLSRKVEDLGLDHWPKRRRTRMPPADRKRHPAGKS
jgi:DNA-binding NtrC family response regulator